jgi:TolB-like protein/DNA-binding winged helix-turn-helix (wHTH) protein
MSDAMLDARYRLASPWRLDVEDERLWNGDSPVRLNHKALLVLRALMDRPGVLVTKDELFEAGWPGLAVSDGVLTTAVKELRQAMGDRARAPTIIETVHGRGYRFLLPVERADASAPNAASRPDAPDETPARPAAPAAPVGGPAAAVAPAAATLAPAGTGPAAGGRREAAAAPPATPAGAPQRWKWPALVTALAALALALWAVTRAGDRPPAIPPAVQARPIERSIAVLPFADLSPDAERWFASGLTEEIVASLARAPDLRVASRAAAARFGTDADPRQSARALGVAHVLAGSVRRAEGRVRVTAQLIRAQDGFQIWAQSYDRPAAEAIAIQQEIAFAIARALRSVMEPGRLRAMLAAGTRSVEAHEAYLRGLALQQRQLRDGDEALAARAGEAFELARRLDPDFSAAHWQAAQGWVGRATRLDSGAHGEGLDERARLARYLERVDAAIATATDPSARLRYAAARAWALIEPRQAMGLMRQYLARRPHDIDAWEDMAVIAAQAGRRDALADAAARVHALSIAEGAPRSRAITLTVMAADSAAAVARARRQLALRPDHAVTLYQAHRAMIQAGMRAEAARLLPGILGSELPGDTRALAELRQACADGRVADARRAFVRIEREGDRPTIWQARQVLGDPRAADTLRPLDRPETLPTLAEFMIHPTFDARAFPELMARLTRAGVSPPPAIAMPQRCEPPR